MTNDAHASRGARPTDFTGRLRRLIAILHPPGQPPLTDRAIADRVKEQGGSISPAYVSELRGGKKTKPGLDHVLQLAAAFGISAGYFTDPEVFERVSGELDRLEQVNQSSNNDLVELATRTANLGATDRDALAALVQRELAARTGQHSDPQRQDPGQQLPDASGPSESC